ncbi:hypothetical protein ACFQV2_18300 [Actinokineospora soli]|uniref:Uncharacterized protein n=1 Tax=Actinokineospora soli TaxID=1048753 RepID=A0ABW2TQU2_9PSEU
MTRADVADTEPRFDERQPPAPDDLFDADDEAEPADVGAFSAVDPRVAEALRYAGRELRSGVCETGTNGGIPLSRYVHWFNPGLGPVPWCAFFISWCWDNATDRNRRTPGTTPATSPPCTPGRAPTASSSPAPARATSSASAATTSAGC